MIKREGGKEEKSSRGDQMTVIDYLPVGEEVRPNVLLSQTKKCIISKVMACIIVFLHQVHLDKQQNNSAVTGHQHVACINYCVQKLCFCYDCVFAVVRCMQVCLCVQFICLLIYRCLHRNCQNTWVRSQRAGDNWLVKMFRHISIRISFHTVYLPPSKEIFTIFMSLLQYYINDLLAGSLKLGCAVSSLLRRPLQWELPQLAFL